MLNESSGKTIRFVENMLGIIVTISQNQPIVLIHDR